jgi:thiol-disulfide isomerase/thioredoxin
MKKFLFASIVLIWTACATPAAKNINFVNLVKSHPYTVVMFIAPDCPLCNTLAKPYSELSKAYPEVQFLAVHSGKNYEAMELNRFATENGFTPSIFRDLDYAVAHQLEATVTPEFFLLDSSQKILYRGMMDDRILELGRYKQKWSEFYLKDAIENTLAGNIINPKVTEPVGCVLEY